MKNPDLLKPKKRNPRDTPSSMQQQQQLDSETDGDVVLVSATTSFFDGAEDSRENGNLEGKIVTSPVDNNENNTNDDDDDDDDDGGGVQLEDSELNGVSSLLKMQRSGSFGGLGLGSVLDVIEEQENINWDKVEEFEFKIGDFVWGKVKSHPWWPGRIYDPSDASPVANKIKHRHDKLLVAYFGDATFAWCYPSQLRPFTQHFMQMSQQSNSKGFINAVHNALDEFGMILDLSLTGSCVMEHNLMAMAVNYGIKDGVFVPKLEQYAIQPLLDAFSEPLQIVDSLKTAARDVMITNMLDFTILKSWLSAFYSSKGGCALPNYYDPLPVPGLEDKTIGSSLEFNHYSTTGSSGQETIKEDLISLSVGAKPGEETQNSTEIFQGVSGDKPHHSKKQRSIAEILGRKVPPEAENKEVDMVKSTVASSNMKSSAKKKKSEDRSEAMVQNLSAGGKNEREKVHKEGTSSGKTLLSVKRREMSNGNKNKGGNVVKEAKDLGEPTPSTGRKKRKVNEDQNEVGVPSVKKMETSNVNERGDVAKAATDSSEPSSSTRRKKKKAGDKVNGEDQNEVGVPSVKRREMSNDNKNKGDIVAKEATDLGGPTPSTGRKKKKAGDKEKGEERNRAGVTSTKKREISSDKKITGGDAAKSETGVGEPTLSTGRKKRKVSDEAKGDNQTDVGVPSVKKGKRTDDNKHKVGDDVKAAMHLGDPTLSTGRKKRMVGDKPKGENQNEVGDKAKDGQSMGKPKSPRGKKRNVSDEASDKDQNEVGDKHKAGKNVVKPTSPREKKSKSLFRTKKHDGGDSHLKSRKHKEKKLSTPYARAKGKVSSLEVGETGTCDVDDSTSKSIKRKETELSESHAATDKSHEVGDSDKKKEPMKTPISNKEEESASVLNGDLGCGATEHINTGSVLRDRKKSKYLSPPYTNLNRGQKRTNGGAESRKISAEALVGERMSKAASNLIGSLPIPKFDVERSEKQPSKELCTGHDGPDNSVPQAPKLVQKIFIDPGKLKAPANEVLSEIRSAALSPASLKQFNSWDTVEGFLLAFRSLTYHDGSSNISYAKHEEGEINSEESVQSLTGNKQVEDSSHDYSSENSKTKTERSEVKKSDKPKVRAPDAKTDEKGPAAALFVTFEPGSSLPSRNDLIKMYGKFGSLHREATEMICDENYARIVFFKSSDAEEAFNDSQLASPFSSASVKFRLEYLSDETKTRELQEISSVEPSYVAEEVKKIPKDKPGASGSHAGDTSQLDDVKQKLGMMATIVQNSVGEMTEEIRRKLENEAKALLQVVSAMPSSSL